MRQIRSQTDGVSVASARDRSSATIPPFYFAGRIKVGVSGLWYPPADILLVSIWASSTTVGNFGGTALYLQYGDDKFNPGGTTIPTESYFGSTVIIEQDNKLASAKFKATTAEPLLVSPSNWLRIACLGAGGHENITVQINGEYV